jgi:2-amino-4-hydroxy-6-hydroxymethyldihydropteridine diphosphokinase
MICRAVDALDAMSGISVTARSSLYATPPWGVEDQPDFVNACALARTSLAPLDLLAACKDLEVALGRAPGARWGPRLIDIDVLWMDGVEFESERLTLPHPRLTERAFVLVPLAEIAPEMVVGGRTVVEWVGGVDQSAIRQI